MGEKDKRTLREAKQGREVSSNPTYQGGPGPVTNRRLDPGGGTVP